MTNATTTADRPVAAIELRGGRKIVLTTAGPMLQNLAIVVDDTRARKGRSFAFQIPFDAARRFRQAIEQYERLHGDAVDAEEAERLVHIARVEAARARKGPPVFGAMAAEPPSIDPRDIVRHTPGQPRGKVSP